MNGKLAHVFMREKMRNPLEEERKWDVVLEVMDLPAILGQQGDLILSHLLVRSSRSMSTIARRMSR